MEGALGMKVQATIVIREGMTWKDVRRALIQLGNDLGRGETTSEEQSIHATDATVADPIEIHVGGRRVGKLTVVPDEDEEESCEMTPALANALHGRGA